MRVEESSLSANCSYHSNRWTSGVGQLDPHSFLQPNARWGLPQVEGRLINVDDLYLRRVHHEISDLHRELLLLQLQLPLLLMLGAIDYLGLHILSAELLIDAPHRST